MSALWRLLASALLGIDAPYICEHCGEHRRGPRALARHIDFDHQDELRKALP